LTRPREKLASVTDGFGTVWFLGGRDPDSTQAAFGNVDIVQANSVKPAGTVTPVAGAGAVWWPDAGVCLLGGQIEHGFTSDVSCLNDSANAAPATLSWARAGLGAAVIGPSVFVVGGYSPGSHGTAVVEGFRSTDD
jgi:hypothetical protein